MPADVGNTHSKSSEAAEKAKHVTGSMLSTLVAGALEVLAGASAAVKGSMLAYSRFGSVFVLIGSIPFVGAFFISMGGCAVPHFFDNEMIQEGHNKFNTGDSIPMQDMQKKSMQ
ncbi:hypothetical protein SARC_08864 [Sphaeroforma arctica JP610]|uniref:Uncharacterized protein n=1 Tax=Sphaeroforma arctica JP610 TaxID=667725 RepID=A0A0L0FPH1_9EUKA|nr:hypothetical protein SARC_08864 [Sphaeroforma arctica JP610]KNC78710.1 hypothetical protein SARC_08864 [Sphaeroforma arctica JP610]|eukprot:XP_014152612.1 hypothetical protein SARC_08864 [Sphaeroforma arctica JP610]